MKRAPQTIEQIVSSFKDYGLGDIEHNKTNVIAAFILCICFIDQLASFRYNNNGLEVRWNMFIDEYMPVYSGKRLYTNFRNSLIHHYSSCGKFGISYGDYFNKEIDTINGVTIINPYLFIENLNMAFIVLEQDFNSNKDGAKDIAIKRSIKHPVLISKNI